MKEHRLAKALDKPNMQARWNLEAPVPSVTIDFILVLAHANHLTQADKFGQLLA